MTLLVAGTSGDSAWMVADTAITGGNVPLRKHENQIKIVPSSDGRALIGFAGDQYYGARLLERARLLSAEPSTVETLKKHHLEHPSVDFAYAYRDEQGPHLFRISGGAARRLNALHIGNLVAFSKFQAIRHRLSIDPVPDSVSILFCESRSTTAAPDKLHTSLLAMLRLLAEWPERDVGGFAVPYYLNEEGAFLCGYGYSVTDPLLAKLTVGEALPHGTAQGGGFALSLTEWCKDRGLVVYWLQKPGGTVFVRTEGGFNPVDFPGMPNEFKTLALGTLGKPVEILFGEGGPQGATESITILRDRYGKPGIAVAKHGDSFSFSVLNVETEFRVEGRFELKRGQLDLSAKGAPAKVTVNDGGDTVRIELYVDGEPSEILLDASGLDDLIAALGSARASMKEQVPEEPNLPTATAEVIILDPAWRTSLSPHPSLEGLMLRLRHLQFGWVSFLLPHHESVALAQWLLKSARRKEQLATGRPTPDKTQA